MIKIVNEVDFSGIENDDFGEEWVERIPKECIKGATLLSFNEIRKLMTKEQRKADDYWWTRTPGCCSLFVYTVDYDGDIFYNSYNTTTFSYGVRPALQICNTENSNLSVGDKFYFSDYIFTIISNNLAICNDIIGECCFNEDEEKGNDYEKSDVKKFVDNWFNKAYNEYEG